MRAHHRMDRIKSLVKQIGLAARLNSRIKEAGVEHAYRRTFRHYAGITRSTGHDTLLAGRFARRGARSTEAPARIFLLGTDEQQDRSGMLQALARIGDLRWFTRTDGSYGQNDPASPRQRIANNTRRLWQQLLDLEDTGWTADLLVGQTWAAAIEPEVLSRIRDRWGTLVVNISMDDRHQYWGRKRDGKWDGTYRLIPHLDLALTSAPECVEWYEKEGCPALFFPMASDPEIFRPMPELPKIHDVCFVGGRYGVREAIVSTLRRAGIRVAAFGSGWEGGRIATEDMPGLFAQSRIILGVGTIGHCRDFYALKLRDFDGPMSGTTYLTHNNPDLQSVFEVGKEIATYENIPDCVRQVRRLLRNTELREAIGGAGRQRCLRDHTWDARFGGLYKLLKLGAQATAR